MLTIEKINKRAKSKFTQQRLIESMINLDTKYQSKYIDTLHCSSLIYQKGEELTSRYCKHRWCRICNRIRTGKLINGYQLAIDGMKDKQFLTLTIPNVSAEKLRLSFKSMILAMRKIQEKRRSKKMDGINCIRKLECTYNALENNYHPHFHFIVDGIDQANYMIEEWLKLFPDANLKAQKVVEAHDPMELFKYFTKLTSKTGNDDPTQKNEDYAYPEALDIIFQSIEKLRIIQPMGKIKMVSDEIDELNAIAVDETIANDVDDKFYIWQGSYWYSPFTGIVLSSFAPDENLIKFANRIKYITKEIIIQ